MEDYEEELKKEIQYLKKTLLLIRNNLYCEEAKFLDKRKNLLEERRYMYENTVHSSDDFGKISDAVQYISPLAINTFDYNLRERNIERLKKLESSPYFARIDFCEEQCEEEKIYIGLSNVMDKEIYKIYIYDWRAPIASTFYRYELGEASYSSPNGRIYGKINLKRQYEIKNSKLEYFFDSSINIMDDILKKVLSTNTSAKMKSIVETIQREQDIIIRDIENDLLIVQGVAGSGKTSVALHRVAFLMYQGLVSKLSNNNVIFISPNNLFDKYISNVLPELGEEHVKATTFESIFKDVFQDKVKIKSRNLVLEEIINARDTKKKQLVKDSMEFKLSKNFILILNNYLSYFEHKMLKFTDIYYNGEYIAHRELLKTELINYSKVNIPLEKRLLTIERRLMSRLKELRKIRISKLEQFVSAYPEHVFEIKSFARLISLKQSYALQNIIYKSTRLDVLKIYMELFQNKDLFYRMARGMEVPRNIEEILDYTNSKFNENALLYEDGIALLCLKLKMSGDNLYKSIKQVVVDEAQDYYPMHFEVLKYLYSDAKYTIMGDINQSIEKTSDLTIYDDIENILNKKKKTRIFLSKSFRCSYEITNFSSKLINTDIEINSFERHEDFPKIYKGISVIDMETRIVNEVIDHEKSGYKSIAIICKSMKESEHLFRTIRNRLNVVLLSENQSEIISGVVICPIYIAKGLEFDAVIVYQSNNVNYITEEDKRLLYIATTRALHKLSFYYTNEISKFIDNI